MKHCEDCIYLIVAHDIQVVYCGKILRELPYKETETPVIPDWCPEGEDNEYTAT